MPLETRELIHSVSNNFLTEESTSISENLTYLHHDPSMYIKLHHKLDIKKVKKSNWQKLGEKQRKTCSNWQFFLYVPRLIPYASRLFGPTFGGLLDVQMSSRCTFWKGLSVYFPTQVEFFNLASICPSKSPFSQHCFLCVKIGAVRSFFECFLYFLGLKTYPNFLYIGRKAYFFMPNPKMLSFCQLEAPIKNEHQVAWRIEQKTLC